jgi:hypothetical protein
MDQGRYQGVRRSKVARLQFADNNDREVVMGGGSWDTGAYSSAKSTRAATGAPAFAYTKHATSVHPNLDPKRINTKPFGMLESRDSVEHPNSNPVLVCFDVTGSNVARAGEFQDRLPNLMDLLNKYMTDPQVAVAANDDFKVEGENSVQISDFESDNRVDDHIRNIWLVNDGGGNDGESYDLLLYAAARKVVLDSVEKRGKKGYMFMYADEPIFDHVDKQEVKAVFGDSIEKNIPIAEVIEEARRSFNIFVIWPKTSSYRHAYEQYVKLFGKDFVMESQHPNMLCELIASTVALYEEKATPDAVIDDLKALGVGDHEAKALVKHVARAASADLATSGAGKAARL